MAQEEYRVGEFTAIPNWFIYTDELPADPVDYPAVGSNFGLKSDKSWLSLKELLALTNESNKKSNSPIRYKLVYAARHGQGWHNVAESKYSTKEWDAKWALLTGDGEIVWGPDPELTPLGEEQARDVNKGWQLQIQASKNDQDFAPLPTRLFSSPFKRSCKTLELSYDGILLPVGTSPPPSMTGSQGPVDKPYIKEDLREQYGDDHEAVHRSDKSTIEKNFPQFQTEPGFTEGDERFKVSKNDKPLITEGFRENFRDLHTCDERSSKTVLQNYIQPGWEFKEGFAEEDELFGKIHETVDQMTFRIAGALRDVFTLAPDDDVVHISSHSGVMESLFRATGHQLYKPATGAIVPMLIKWDPTQTQ
ncbi:unnamed protein product [Sympodiomycopsis kandeliae]